MTTYIKTGEALRGARHCVAFFTPQQFRTVALPSYPSIRLAVRPRKKLCQLLDEFAPEAVHLAAEGPLGFAGRAYCRSRNLHFTSSYHTQFPHYVRMRAPIPMRLSYSCLRWSHTAAERMFVPTEHQRAELEGRGFRNLVIWPRGVDTELFRPRDRGMLQGTRPIFMYMGRVAVEKNIRAFLDLDLPGTKYVVGDGPDLALLRKRYRQMHFTGFKFGKEPAGDLADADVFVFPSRTDTFGLVMLKTLACGVPVAAYPVTGPVDILVQGETGIIDEDLGATALETLKLDRSACRRHALAHSWASASEIFAEHLVCNVAAATSSPGR